MNDKQIKKLMKKVSKPFEEKRKKQEAEKAIKRKEHEKNLSEIRQTIENFEIKYPNRGNCCCLWNNNIYVVKDNKIMIINSRIDQLKIAFELIEKQNDREYYMLDEHTYTELKKLLDWVAENYAQIKIAVASANSKTEAKNKLLNMSILGSIFEKFQKEFPDKSMMHLIDAIKTMDSIMQRTLYSNFKNV
jgi:hypothetical protein